LIERAATADAKVLVAYNLRWHRLVREARRLLVAGAIGEPEVLTSSFTTPAARFPESGAWRRVRETGGGVLAELASHHFDLWRLLLEDEAVEVSALARDGTDEEETAAVQARMRSGTVVTGFFSQRSLDRQEVEIVGTEGRLSLDLYRFDGLHMTRAPGRVGDARDRGSALVRLVGSLGRAAADARTGGVFVASFVEEWRHFLAVCRGDVEPECTLEDGRASLTLLRAAAESASTGVVTPVAEALAAAGRIP
jgi:myo-inositol 2-dehydrogenase/D-chiro-inositol 1-dehydrogenase